MKRSAIAAALAVCFLAACQPETAQHHAPAASAAPASEAAMPNAASGELQAALAAYKAYVQAEVKSLLSKTEQFVAAVKANQIDEAKSLFAPTRVHYERIEPVAELFEALDTAIDVRADDFKKQEKDPAFSGFHRIEYALWVENSTAGVQTTADKLLADVRALQAEIDKLDFPAEKVVGGAAELIEEIAQGKISGEEDRYSHTDLSDFQANLDGSQKIVDLFRSHIAAKDASLLETADQKFKQINELLGKYKTDKGFVSYTELTDQDRAALAAPVNALAEDLSKLRGTLGLD